jgi:hypothetical protein
MRIDVYHHIELESGVLSRLDAISQKLDLVLKKEDIIMSMETDALDELEKQTAAIDGAEESAEAAFIRLADMITALKNAQTDPATAARITAAADGLRSMAAKLGTAVGATPV